jgi:hypothetical protein
MDDVTQYIKKYWFFFFLFVGWLLLFSYAVTIHPSFDPVQVPATQQSEVSTEILELHKQMEALQTKDSIIESKIKSIDSLRLENARHTPAQSVRSHYGDLSKRYANDPRIK